jgi:acyl-CoA synthetase (AMP-forming)/AMP-acid ligase II
MATSFKAIEPAPVSLLRLDDPNEQMLLADLAGRQMRPLQPRSIPFPVVDSVGGKNQQNLATFDNLAAILRYRATNDSHRHATAFTAVDSKGKEPVTISWDKLNARAEKVAATIRDKSGLQLGDRVALIYRKSEVLDFIVALFGCFLAGMVAIPINAADDLSELSFILNLTSANLVLTTDFNHKAFIKDMQTRSMEIPSNVEWWKTNDFGTWYPTKKIKDYPAIKVPELAYIEYAKAVNGELKGVTITHQTIMAEGRMYKASVTETDVTVGDTDGALNVVPKARPQHSGFDTVVTYLEPRQQVGMVLSVLCSVYCGNHTVFTSGSIVDTPAVWIYVLSKYRGKSGVENALECRY